MVIPTRDNNDGVVRMLPHRAVAVVSLHNAHYNEYENYSGSGPVHLLPSGHVVIDGTATQPGDKLYFDEVINKYARSLSPEAREKLESELQLRIETVTRQSESINRSVVQGPPDGRRPSLMELLESPVHDQEAWKQADPNAWKYARYPNARPGFSWELRDYEEIDGISPVHDPQALKAHIVQAYMDKHLKFVVGGFLHVEEGQDISAVGKAAIMAYRNLGGRLGKSALDAINETSSAFYSVSDGKEPHRPAPDSPLLVLRADQIGRWKVPDAVEEATAASGLRHLQPLQLAGILDVTRSAMRDTRDADRRDAAANGFLLLQNELRRRGLTEEQAKISTMKSAQTLPATQVVPNKVSAPPRSPPSRDKGGIGD